MSYEVLHPHEPEKAFATYALAVPLVANAVADIPATVPTTVPPGPLNSQDDSSFGRYRELWRWAERVLRRGVILGARICDITSTDGESGLLWKLFDQYHACSARWPPL